MRNVEFKFVMIGLIYFLLAMIQGQFMAITANYSLYPMHAHAALVGGVLMVLYGLTYRAFPAMGTDGLVALQFWTANVGAPIFFIGIWVSITGGRDPQRRSHWLDPRDHRARVVRDHIFSPAAGMTHGPWHGSVIAWGIGYNTRP